MANASDVPDGQAVPAPRVDGQESLDRRLWPVLIGLYVAQAIPVYLVAAAIPPILRSYGVDLATIGGLGILLLPWVLKALWAPLVDRLSRHPSIGRKGVVLITQALVVLGIVLLSTLNPAEDLSALFPILLLMSFAASTQDIASDGYAVEHLPKHKQAGGNAIQSGSVAIGVLAGGTGTLILHDAIGWQLSILVAGVASLIAVVPFLLLPEHVGRRPVTMVAKAPSIRAFLARPGIWAMVAFAMIFRLPEGLIQALEQSFLVDHGFSLSQIGLISGGSAAAVGLGGAALGVILIRRFGLAAFFVGILVMRFLIFAGYGIAAVWGLPDAVLVALSFLKTANRYMELVGLYTAFMRVASLNQAGTDFTTLSSANLLVYMCGSMLAGGLAEAFGYAPVFWLATVLSVFTGLIAMHLLNKSTEATALAPQQPVLHTGKGEP
ncbi:MFS transporter [Gymnodinialimonas sp. 2305UL16-5]|uniref:MFS transporter n=1 Tax=Gymnodinialimonas mytili TaxID=3126503 RepID=UPI0030A09136